MKDSVYYYDGYGRPCEKDDAWSMHIVSDFENGEPPMCVISGCNGHKAGDRIVLTMEEELAILKPWAAKDEHHFDIVRFAVEVDSVRVYSLGREIHRGHKTGMPFYAIVRDGEPIMLDRDSEMYANAYPY